MVVRTSHLVVAVLLHVVVLGMLLIGFRCSRKVEPPPVIQATIVGEKEQAKPQPPPREDTHKAEEEKKNAEAERKKEEELQHRAELETQRKAEQQAKLKAQQEAKQNAAEETRRKKEEMARKVKEEEDARHEEDKKRVKQAEDEIRQQLQSEEKQRQQQAVATKQQVWIQQIQDKVRRNWLRPPGFSSDFKCRLRIQLLPGGQIVGVTPMETCGSPVLNDSVQRAVYKSDPLPTPDDPSLFERELTFTFIP